MMTIMRIINTVVYFICGLLLVGGTVVSYLVALLIEKILAQEHINLLKENSNFLSDNVVEGFHRIVRTPALAEFGNDFITKPVSKETLVGAILKQITTPEKEYIRRHLIDT